MFKTILLMRFRKRLEVWSIMIKWKFCLSIHNEYQLLLCLFATFARSTTQFQTLCMNRGTDNSGIDIFWGCIPLSKQIIKKKFRPNCVCEGGGVMLIWLIFPYKTLLGFLINPWNRKSHQMIFRPPYIMLIRDFIPVLSNNHDNDPSSPQKERKLIWNEVIYTFIRQSWIDDTCA